MNPFQQSMVRMVFGEGMGKCVSVSGFTVEADEHGEVVVPAAVVAELEAHGMRRAPQETPKKK